MLLLAHKLLTHFDIAIRDLVDCQDNLRLVSACLLKVRTRSGAFNRDLAALGATDRANLTVHARTMPFRASLITYFALDRHRQVSTSSYYHEEMRRIDVYLKVELDLDPKESPERVAAEICRMINRVYGVRKAEVSSIMPRESS